MRRMASSNKDLDITTMSMDNFTAVSPPHMLRRPLEPVQGGKNRNDS
jgi:hypothetical protein